jgi:hypothetical protein
VRTKRERLVKLIDRLDNVQFSNYEHESNRYDALEKARAELKNEIEKEKAFAHNVKIIPDILTGAW